MPATPTMSTPTSTPPSPPSPPPEAGTVEITSSSGGVPGGIEYQPPVPLSTQSASPSEPIVTEEKGKGVNTLLTVLLVLMIVGVIGAIVWLLKPWEEGFSLSDTFSALKDIF